MASVIQPRRYEQSIPHFRTPGTRGLDTYFDELEDDTILDKFKQIRNQSKEPNQW